MSVMQVTQFTTGLHAVTWSTMAGLIGWKGMNLERYGPIDEPGINITWHTPSEFFMVSIE